MDVLIGLAIFVLCVFTGMPFVGVAVVLAQDASGRVGQKLGEEGSPTAMELAKAILTPSTARLLVPGSVSKTGHAGQFEVYTNTSLQGFSRNCFSWALMSTGKASGIAGQATTFYSYNTGGPTSPPYSHRGDPSYDIATLSLELRVPPGMTTLSFDWEFATEENPTYIGAYVDWASAIVTTSTGSTNILLLPDGKPVDVDNAVPFSNGVTGDSYEPLPPYPSPNDTVYNAMTGMYKATFNVSPFVGQNIKIEFLIADENDEVLDSALFIDNLSITPITEVDIYWLAKAIQNEAGNAQEAEQIAVGWTVLNRLNNPTHGKDNIPEIVQTKYQPYWITPYKEPTVAMKQLAQHLLEGEYPDPTCGATHFISPRSMEPTPYGKYKIAGTDLETYIPYWALPIEYKDKPPPDPSAWEITPYYRTIDYPTTEWVAGLENIRDWWFMFYRPCIPQVNAQMNSPSELRVYDSEGRVTGLVNGTVVMEIPGSDYCEDTVTILYPYGTYRYVAAGTIEGVYGLTVTAVTTPTQENISFSAIDIPTAAGASHQYTIDWAVLSLGGEGVTVQVDSNGDGIFEHTFTSDSELTQDEFMLLTATTIDFDPDTLDLKSKGEPVTVYIELPVGHGCDVSQTDVSSIRLNGIVSALAKPTKIGDYDGDGIPDLMVKFNRKAVQKILAVGENVEITVSGTLTDGRHFEGSDTIRVILPP